MNPLCKSERGREKRKKQQTIWNIEQFGTNSATLLYLIKEEGRQKTTTTTRPRYKSNFFQCCCPPPNCAALSPHNRSTVPTTMTTTTTLTRGGVQSSYCTEIDIAMETCIRRRPAGILYNASQRPCDVYKTVHLYFYISSRSFILFYFCNASHDSPNNSNLFLFSRFSTVHTHTQVSRHSLVSNLVVSFIFYFLVRYIDHAIVVNQYLEAEAGDDLISSSQSDTITNKTIKKKKEAATTLITGLELSRWVSEWVSQHLLNGYESSRPGIWRRWRRVCIKTIIIRECENSYCCRVQPLSSSSLHRLLVVVFSLLETKKWLFHPAIKRFSRL